LASAYTGFYMNLFFYSASIPGVVRLVLLTASCSLLLAVLLLAGVSQPAFADNRLPASTNLTTLMAAASPGKGVFLVASEDMEGPVFKHAVILLVFADETGALGLIINRPTPHTLEQAIPALKGLKGAGMRVFDGGPVERVTLQVLFRSDDPPAESFHIFEDVYFSRSEPMILDMVKVGVPSSAMRLYAGYAGWAPGQLEMEMERGGWHLIEADVRSLFDEKHDELWRQLVPGTASRWVLNGDWQDAVAGLVSRP
jgi:putative transcriptional regulator